MAIIYVVQGSSGEYSDRTEWPLKAFRDEKRAQRLVVEAQARANEMRQFRDSDWDAYYEARFGDDAIPNDPRFLNEFDHAGDIDARYSYFQIELVEEAE